MVNTIKLTISLSRDLAEFADKLADQTHCPRSQIFAELLRSKQREMLRSSLIEGYQALAEEQRRFAREALPLAAEIWEEYGS